STPCGLVGILLCKDGVSERIPDAVHKSNPNWFQGLSEYPPSPFTQCTMAMVPLISKNDT
ncbi:hypothetical protein E1B28_000630, partial [Marasmius oreades]